MDEEKLVASINASSARTRTLWTVFIGYIVYLLATLAEIEHVDLLLSGRVDIPIVRVNLPLNGFFIFAPAILLVLHIWILLQNRLISLTFSRLRTVARKEYQWSEFDYYAVLQGPRRLGSDTISTVSFSLVWGLSFLVAPPVTLLFFQGIVLPTHDTALVYLLRIFLIIDLMITAVFVLSADTPSMSALSKVNLTAKRNTATFLLLIAVCCSLLSWKYLTLPHEKNFGSIPYIIDDELSRERRAVSTLFSRNLILTFEDTSTERSTLGAISMATRDFRYAYMAGSNFDNFDFRGADFTGADLRGTSFREAKLGCFPAYGNVDDDPVCTNFKDAILSGAVFDGADLSGIDLSGHDFSGSTFSGANIEYADFRDADLSGADISGVEPGFILSAGANFGRNSLLGVGLSRDALIGTSIGEPFEITDFRGANLGPRDGVSMDLSGISMTGVNLDGADLSGAIFVGAEIVASSFRGADLSGADFTLARITSVDFEGANLHNAEFEAAILDGVNLRYSTFPGTDRFNGSNFPLSASAWELSVDETEFLKALSVDIAHLKKDRPEASQRLLHVQEAVQSKTWPDKEKWTAFEASLVDRGLSEYGLQCFRQVVAALKKICEYSEDGPTPATELPLNWIADSYLSQESGNSYWRLVELERPALSPERISEFVESVKCNREEAGDNPLDVLLERYRSISDLPASYPEGFYCVKEA
jgi:uncharacterized protein YjbI with pentapeptide repeats